MKEVFVLYGRVHFDEGVYDHDGNRFMESPVLEVYENAEDALTKLKEYVIEAYNYLKKYGQLVINTHFAEVTTEDDLFNDYNCDDQDEASTIEKDISWTYWDWQDGDVDWEVDVMNVPWREQVPILPSLHIRKQQIN